LGCNLSHSSKVRKE